MKCMKTSTGFFPFALFGLLLLSSCKNSMDSTPELRGVWLHPGLFSPDQDRAIIQMDSLFNLYSEVGINNLFCYNTLPDENSFGWDYLGSLIRKGREKGIGIHPIFYPGYTRNLEKEIARNPSWLIRDMDGKFQPHLNLANPEVRKYWVDRIRESLKYDIAGIHLDYIRFPTTQVYSYDSATCEVFKKEFQYSPIEVSHDCGSMIWCEWIKWNSKQVTTLVTDIRHMIKESGKPVLLGADVFPDMETADVLIGQNWEEWISTGLVDFVCPMTYTNNTQLFRDYIRKAITVAGNKCKVYPGIGVHTAHNDITKDLIVKEVEITREEKANGMVFFSGYSFNKEMMDVLKASVFSENQELLLRN
jgi:uncharacterized lipoprotein YddW (UPF0748 family)